MFPVVKVIWVDAVSTNEWKTIPDLKKEEKSDTEPCTTIGFLVRKTRYYFYVANTVSNVNAGEPLVNGIMMIPRKWVLSMQEIHLED